MVKYNKNINDKKLNTIARAPRDNPLSPTEIRKETEPASLLQQALSIRGGKRHRCRRLSRRTELLRPYASLSLFSSP
jgi:hypothetical protein